MPFVPVGKVMFQVTFDMIGGPGKRGLRFKKLHVIRKTKECLIVGYPGEGWGFDVEFDEVEMIKTRKADVQTYCYAKDLELAKKRVVETARKFLKKEISNARKEIKESTRLLKSIEEPQWIRVL